MISFNIFAKSQLAGFKTKALQALCYIFIMFGLCTIFSVVRVGIYCAGQYSWLTLREKYFMAYFIYSSDF